MNLMVMIKSGCGSPNGFRDFVRNFVEVIQILISDVVVVIVGGGGGVGDASAT